MRKVTLLLATVALAALLAALPAWAASTFVVDRTDDEATAMACTAAANDCSLRGAVIAANTAQGADVIDIPANTYTLDIAGAGEETSATGDLDITGALTIDGAGANSTTVTGVGLGDRIFHNQSGAIASISGLTITGGSTDSDNGGGVFNSLATLTVSDTTISGNTTSYSGGGIGNFRGTLTVERSTISDNTANTGGGIFSFTAPDLTSSKTTVTSSTISGNTAKYIGGGVRNYQGLTEIGNSTITDNTAPAGEGSGVWSYGYTDTSMEVYSSIISANTHTDVDYGGSSYPTNSFISEGHNLVGDGNAADAFDAQGDQAGVLDPRLGPLQDNGGPTETHLPLEAQGSPVIDQGNGAQGPATDQRGEARPHDHPGFANAQGSDGSDVGAVEVVASAEPPPPPPPPDDQACTIKGTGGKDVLRGTAHRDVICAYGGNDSIQGRGGNDLMLGGSGDDTIAGGTGDDRLYGGPSGDVLDARDGSGGDLADGGRGDDTCSADRGDRKKNCS